MSRTEQVGHKLFMLRGDRSRAEVAQANNISVSALQMYENGKRMPKDDNKISLARYYNKSVGEIFFD